MRKWRLLAEVRDALGGWNEMMVLPGRMRTIWRARRSRDRVEPSMRFI